MEWQTPRYVEIKMDAELTSYVDDLTVDDGATALVAAAADATRVGA